MLRSKRPTIALTALLTALATAAVAQPTITGINNLVLPRSGRLVIEGAGFGAAGEVRVAGLAAWTTTWTDQRVVAFVPEAAPLGETAVYVVVSGQPSNEVALAVTERRRDGRVRWTFEADGDNLWYRPALAPDGNLYLHTNNETDGLVYALSPDGGLRWVKKVLWYPYVPPTTGPDGTLYVGSIKNTYAISPQGEILWVFVDQGAQGLQVAPTAGPDGLLYGAYDLGLGAFALEPAGGQLEWSHPGDPYMFDYGNPFGTEAVFGPSSPGGPVDQMYVNMDRDSAGRLYAFTLDGNQRFATPVAGWISHQPVIGGDGRIFTPTLGAPTGWGVQAIDPGSGQTLWVYQPFNGNGMSELAIGPDDTIYFASPGHLEALDPHSVSRRWLNANSLVMGRPTLSPDGSTLVLSGVPGSGQPGFIKAFDAANGQELWTVDLPGDPYPGFRVLGTDHPRFTPDGATLYVSTLTVGDATDPRSYLYALDADGAAIFADGFESGDLSAWSAAAP